MSETADLAPPKQCLVGVDISTATYEGVTDAAGDGLSSAGPPGFVPAPAYTCSRGRHEILVP